MTNTFVVQKVWVKSKTGAVQYVLVACVYGVYQDTEVHTMHTWQGV